MNANDRILEDGNAEPKTGPRDKDYPAMRYSDSSRDDKGELVPRRVLNAADDDALGSGWYDSPKKVKARKAAALSSGDSAPAAPEKPKRAPKPKAKTSDTPAAE